MLGEWVEMESRMGLMIIVVVAVIGTPHSVPLLTGFVGLHQEEARLINSTKGCM